MEKMPKPGDFVNLQKERTLHDAEMLKNEAKYVINENGDFVLMATDSQIDKAHEEMEKDLNQKNLEEKYNSYIGKIVTIHFKKQIKPWGNSEKKYGHLVKLTPFLHDLKTLYDTFKKYDEISGEFVGIENGYLAIKLEGDNIIHVSDENIDKIEKQKEEKEMKSHEDCLMDIIEEAQAFTSEETEKLEGFVNDSSTKEQFPLEKLEEISAKDEKFGATNRVLIAARAWLDNRK